MKTLTLIVMICGLDASSGRFDLDCGGFERAARDVAECASIHRELRESAPTNIHVGRYECFRERARVAQGSR